MKFASAAITLAVAAVIACYGASASVAATNNNVGSSATPLALEALEAVKSLETPAGVTLTGSVESISAPAAAEATVGAAVAQGDESHHEGFGGVGHWGNGAWGGANWGAWGGWGIFGPHRFGFNYGGIGGWAYPLGYWNAFGAGMYGGGCGLGVPFGGLFYC